MTDKIINGLIDKRSVHGVNSGFKRLDKYIRGFQGGCSYLFSGLEKSGKTTFLINIISNMINKKKRVGLVSTELDLTQIARKLGKINKIDDSDPEKLNDYREKLEWYLDYSGNEEGQLNTEGLIDVEKLLKQIRQKADAGCEVIFIDNLTVIQNQATWQAMSSAGQKIVTLTKQLKCAVVVVAHTKPHNISFKETPNGVKNLLAENRSEEIFEDQATVIMRPSTIDVYGGGGYASQFDGVILFWRPFQKFGARHLKEQCAVVVDSLRELADSQGSNLVKLKFDSKLERYIELPLTKDEQEKLIFS